MAMVDVKNDEVAEKRSKQQQNNDDDAYVKLNQADAYVKLNQTYYAKKSF